MSKNLKIKHHRLAKGMSQSDMAERLHMSQAGYAKIENGQTKLDVDRLLEIGKILEVDLLELFANAESVSIHNNDISNSNVGYNEITYSDMKENYENRITHLEEEVTFLRSQLANVLWKT